MADTPPFSVLTYGALSEPRLRAHVHRRLDRALGRIGSRVERAITRCEDVNGPRGGVDQVCRIELRLSGLRPLVVEDRAATPREAFDRAARAAKRALRRLNDRFGTGAKQKRRSKRAAVPREPSQPAPPDEGSWIGRRVGRSSERLRRVAERPEKQRRDVWVDTAQPGVSASQRKAGAGSTARRNTKLRKDGMTATLEDSSRSRPSRKSTRRSANRGKHDDNLRLRATNAAHAPRTRASRGRSRKPR